ncbi:transposase [Desulfovibrio sp.]|uniref:transposase n=1 Tax=Desulfovibrio sp. TaxID=885 RepID=UPI003AB24E03
MVIADASGLPLALHTDSAGPHEVTLVQATLDEIVTVGQPRRIIWDRAYDSDPLNNALAAQGIEMIAPHRRNRKRKATQDGRPLRRYRRRWKIERLFAWLTIRSSGQWHAGTGSTNTLPPLFICRKNCPRPLSNSPPPLKKRPSGRHGRSPSPSGGEGLPAPDRRKDSLSCCHV